MFHRAIELNYKEGTTLEVTFQDGAIKRYDMSRLFEKYPQLTELQNRELFLSGKLMGFYGIVWNDELDIETESIYECGETVGSIKPAPTAEIAQEVAAARADKGMTQVELSKRTGIDQADISKIERGLANPSVLTLDKIAKALDSELSIKIKRSA